MWNGTRNRKENILPNTYIWHTIESNLSNIKAICFKMICLENTSIVGIEVVTKVICFKGQPLLITFWGWRYLNRQVHTHPWLKYFKCINVFWQPFTRTLTTAIFWMLQWCFYKVLLYCEQRSIQPDRLRSLTTNQMKQTFL